MIKIRDKWDKLDVIQNGKRLEGKEKKEYLDKLYKYSKEESRPINQSCFSCKCTKRKDFDGTCSNVFGSNYTNEINANFWCRNYKRG